ncbi:MAG: enoyl-ACP reductase FabV [Oscillospiraceae bacterium]|nr:trans-2-enoyl-CoA reductase family protein [Oscillospiraceae bacterium]MDY3066059.1 enoyl-ACP reductase FabV [Oscillospiraceae bacterium]
MIVQPKVRGFICTTAHPEGCRAIVKEQIDYVKAQPKTEGPKKVLVIGASMGYGLSSRIAAAYSCGAATLGVIFDRNGSEKRTGTAGWYNTAAFESFAKADGLYARTVNGDAYSKEVKEEVISIIKEDLGKVGMVVYSLAAPKRVLADGTVCGSVLKTTGEPYTNKTIDLKNRTISEVTIGPATEEEIENTVKVMGGEDWRDWIEALSAADVLEKDTVTVAYSYIGPEITHPIYADGSIGRAKEHLYRTAQEMNEELSGVRAYVSVNKALVTQSSAAIPVVPLYISILYKVMKEKGVHEGCIEQMYRLFHDKLYGIAVRTDTNGYIRLDDYEMQPDVQEEVLKVWDALSNENLEANADLDGYWEDFYRLFGFHAKNVDYDADVDAVVPIAHVE